MTTKHPRRLPLLISASVFVIASCLSCLSCASGPPPGPGPEQIAGMNAKTILVAPFNIVSSLPPELEGSTKIVQAALVEHLEAHGKTVRIIGFRAGRDLWSASMKEVRGSGLPRNFENAARIYARKLGEIVEFDALIVPSIFIQNAKARSRTVRWDGAEQLMDYRGKPPHGLYRQGTFNVRAASAFIYVVDRKGNNIHTKRAGLELIQHIEFKSEHEGSFSTRESHTWRTVNDSPPIEDEERVRAGIAAALSPFLPEEVPAPIQKIPDGDVTPEETRD